MIPFMDTRIRIDSVMRRRSSSRRRNTSASVTVTVQGHLEKRLQCHDYLHGQNIQTLDTVLRKVTSSQYHSLANDSHQNTTVRCAYKFSLVIGAELITLLTCAQVYTNKQPRCCYATAIHFALDYIMVSNGTSTNAVGQ